jgi:hypothetical protein
VSTLFNLPLQDISMADVKSFCAQQIPENISVEYKQGLSDKSQNKQVAKLACALANTYGGVVLWGVQEISQTDGRGLPGAIVGMPAETSPADRLKKICVESIHPPIFPEVVDILFEENGSSRILTVMRIVESDQTPHYLRDGGCVYIRGDDISKPLDKGSVAAPHEIEWLQQRRKLPVEKREQLLQLAERRARSNFQAAEDFMSVSITPLYPREPLIDLKGLLQLHSSLGDYPQRFSAQHSVFSSHIGTSRNGRKYLELNEFGTLFCASNATELATEGEALVTLVLLERLLALSWFATKAYREMHFYGLLQVEAKLSGIRGFGLQTAVQLPVDRTTGVVDDEITFRTIIMTSDLGDQNWVKEMHKNFLWAVGKLDAALSSAKIDADIQYIQDNYKKKENCLLFTM